jgi:hypothetical protein
MAIDAADAKSDLSHDVLEPKELRKSGQSVCNPDLVPRLLLRQLLDQPGQMLELAVRLLDDVPGIRWLRVGILNTS